MAELPKGTRLTDYLSLGVLTTRLPLRQVKAVLEAQGKASRRQRELPAHVVVYYVIALALFMQVSYREVLRCLLEGLTWLLGPEQTVKVTGKSGISQARTRLGWKVLRQLYEEVVKPLAVEATRGAWYRRWRLVSLDGSTLAVADEQANQRAFDSPLGAGKRSLKRCSRKSWPSAWCRAAACDVRAESAARAANSPCARARGSAGSAWRS
jgi:hypothetical protein